MSDIKEGQTGQEGTTGPQSGSSGSSTVDSGPSTLDTPAWAKELTDAVKAFGQQGQSAAPSTPTGTSQASNPPSDGRKAAEAIMDAIAALPEKILQAMDERAPKKPTNDTPKDEPARPPAKKSFAEWWTG